jgi:hypothetical protein
LGILTSRNPIQDAQTFLSKSWSWLHQDNTETIRTVSGDPAGQGALFSRNDNQYEGEPAIEHLDFAASRVIVSGAYQRLATIPCVVSPEPINDALDRKARPKYQRVAEEQPINKVFSSGVGSNDTTPTTSEIKHIFYQYPDDLTWDSRLGGFITTSIFFDVQTDYPLPENPIDSPCQTITIYEWPAGRIFSALGSNTSLSVYAIDIQSERRKGRWVCRGTLASDVGSDFTLIIERYERLTTKPVIAGFTDHAGVINPHTGQPGCLVPKPREEERKQLPDYPLETVPVAGAALVEPLGWTPIAKRVLSIEVGFIPSIADAVYLARQIAAREWRRRDAQQITMPIPDEWLAAGCPPLPVVVLGGDKCHCEGLIVQIDSIGSVPNSSFSFIANRIDRGGVNQVVLGDPIDLGWRVEISIESAPAAPPPEGSDVEISWHVEIGSGLFTILPDSPIDLLVGFGGAQQLLLASLQEISWHPEINGVIAAVTFDPLWADVIMLCPFTSASPLVDLKNGLTITNNGSTLSTAINDPSGMSTGIRSLDGNSYIDIDTTGQGISGDFCFEFWIYPTADGSPGALWGLSDARGAVVAQPHQLYVYNDGAIGLYSPETNESAAGALSLNAWHYVNLNRSGNTIKLHVDNVEVLSQTRSGSYDLSAVYRIGGIQNAGFKGLTGYLSNLRITRAFRSGTTTPTLPYPTAGI